MSTETISRYPPAKLGQVRRFENTASFYLIIGESQHTNIGRRLIVLNDKGRIHTHQRLNVEAFDPVICDV